MLDEVYEYVTKGIVYILVFNSLLEDGNREYIVCYDLKNTNMSVFINSLENDEVTNTGYRIWCYESTQHVVETVHYTDSAPRKPWLRYHDFVRTNNNPNVKFKIVEVPYTKHLHERAVPVRSDGYHEFSLDEVRLIFKYIFMNLDDDGKLSFDLCMTFQVNMSLFQTLRAEEECDDDLRTEVVAVHGSNFDKALIKFRESMNRNVVLHLTRESRRVAKVFGSNRAERIYNSKVQINELNVGYLFERCDVRASFLRDNAELFYKKLGHNFNGARLTLILRETLLFKSLVTMMSRDMVLASHFKWVSELQLWQSSHIDRVTIEIQISNVYQGYSIMCTKTPFDSIYKIECSIDFINSVAQPIRDMVLYYENSLGMSVDETAAYVTHLKGHNLVFSSNFVFKKCFKTIKMYRASVEEGSVVALKGRFDELDIKYSVGEFDLVGVFALGVIKLLNNISRLYLRMESADNSSELLMSHALVEEHVLIDERITIVCLEDSCLSKGARVLVGENHRKITISGARGTLNLQGLVTANLHAESDTSVKICRVKNSIFKLQLVKYVVKQPIELMNCFYDIKLIEVTLDDDLCLVINENCKNVLIFQCVGTYDLSRPARFISVEIGFSAVSPEKLTVKGPIRTESLFIHDIPDDIPALARFFSEFEEINHLLISHSLELKRSVSLECLILYRHKMVESNKLANNDPSAAQNTIGDESLLCADEFDTRAEEILAAIFNTCAVKKVEGLEYRDIQMSNRNSRYLQEMQNLQILRIELNNLTDNSFKYLPSCLKLLSLIRAEPITRINIDQSPSLNTATALSALKVLIIDGKFLSDMLFSHSIPPSLEALVTKYANLRTGTNVPGSTKVKLRKLRVYAEFDLIDQNTRSPLNLLVTFLYEIFNHVERECLQSLVFSTYENSYQIDPETLCVVKQRPAAINKIGLEKLCRGR